MRYLAGEVLVNFSESEAFSGKDLILGEISFLILFTSVWTSDLFPPLTLKPSIFYRIPLGTNIPNWLTNHRLFRINLLLFNWSADQMC